MSWLRELGGTGLQVSALGLGTVKLGRVSLDGTKVKANAALEGTEWADADVVDVLKSLDSLPAEDRPKPMLSSPELGLRRARKADV